MTFSLSSSTTSVHHVKTLEALYRTRFLDEKMSKLVRQNKGGTFHLSVAGHEMIGVVSGLSLIPGKDWGLPYYRDRAFAVGLGCDPKELIGALLARDVGHHSSGRMMPEHFSHTGLRLPCQSSAVGSQFLQAVGVAKAVQLSGEDEVVYVSAGDGATSQGDFHEALNFACLHRLPLIFVIQDNGFAISVPLSEQTAGASIEAIGRGYAHLDVHGIDGCDYEATTRALKAAVDRARAKEGPSLIVAKVPRIGPHSSSDDPKKYKSEAQMEQDRQRDPLERFEAWLLDLGLLNESDMEEIRRRVRDEVELAAEAAEQVPFPATDSVTDHVFKEVSFAPSCKMRAPGAIPGEQITMVDALNHALIEEMEKDAKVVVFGQDVAHGKGGVFGVTRGLTDQFGVERCFNTPLAESTIIGLAIGMSIAHGFKPVAEIQFADYLWTGINQLFNELASFHYRSNGEWHCPVVIRMPYGGYIQGGPYHSQSIEAFLCHCPGLKVVIPSNASDAKRLLKGAIRDPNPVIFLEHKALYRQRLFCAREETGPNDYLELGKAHIVKPGRDLTLVGWGMTIFMAHQVAQELEKEDISVEVIDLRTLAPLDFASVRASVEKTGKLAIAHEATATCGFGAEIAALISESCFESLDAPIVRITGKHCPVPYCKSLEDAVLPQLSDLDQALRKLASY